MRKARRAMPERTTKHRNATVLRTEARRISSATEAAKADKNVPPRIKTKRARGALVEAEAKVHGKRSELPQWRNVWRFPPTGYEEVKARGPPKYAGRMRKCPSFIKIQNRKSLPHAVRALRTCCPMRNPLSTKKRSTPIPPEGCYG